MARKKNTSKKQYKRERHKRVRRLMETASAALGSKNLTKYGWGEGARIEHNGEKLELTVDSNGDMVDI